MFAFPSLLVKAAEDAGMKVPKDPDNYNAATYPHFHVFCNAQIGKRMPYPGVHFDNARVVADIPDDAILHMTMEDLTLLGFLG